MKVINSSIVIASLSAACTVGPLSVAAGNPARRLVMDSAMKLALKQQLGGMQETASIVREVGEELRQGALASVSTDNNNERKLRGGPGPKIHAVGTKKEAETLAVEYYEITQKALDEKLDLMAEATQIELYQSEGDEPNQDLLELLGRVEAKIKKYQLVLVAGVDRMLESETDPADAEKLIKLKTDTDHLMTELLSELVIVKEAEQVVSAGKDDADVLQSFSEALQATYNNILQVLADLSDLSGKSSGRRLFQVTGEFSAVKDFSTMCGNVNCKEDEHCTDKQWMGSHVVGAAPGYWGGGKCLPLCMTHDDCDKKIVLKHDHEWTDCRKTNHREGWNGQCEIRRSPFCFSALATVEVLGKGQVQMQNLMVGDEVLTEEGTYESIYAWGHKHTTQVGDFLQLHTTSSKEGQHPPLEMTSDHLVFVNGKTHPVPAGTVRAGDILFGKGGSINTVTRIEVVTRDGLYAPLTPSGKILVDGNVASTYVKTTRGTTGTVELDNGMQLSFLSEQWLSHFVLAPFRLLTMGVSPAFGNYFNQDTGIVWYASFWLEAPRWLGALPPTASFALGLFLAIFFFGPFYVWEALFGATHGPLVALMIGVVLASVVAHDAKHKKKSRKEMVMSNNGNAMTGKGRKLA